VEHKRPGAQDDLAEAEASPEDSQDLSEAVTPEATAVVPDVAAATPAGLELAILEERANTLFFWMQQVREKPSEYNGRDFAELAPGSVGQNLKAVADFYGEFFARFRERFPVRNLQ
jgi:hypothetical protein